MIKLSKSISSVEPSPTQAAAARAKELKAAGRDIVSFTLGEPDFDTPEHVKAAALEALNKGYTKYTPVAGIPELRRAIAQKVKRFQQVDYSPQEVVVTNGGKQALAAACAVLLDPGDEVVIGAPYWTSYPDIVKLTGAVPVIVETRPQDGYLMTPESLTRHVTPRTRMIIINSPSNPTGGCYSREQLNEIGQAIAALPNKEDIVVLSDEVYEHIVFDGLESVSFALVAPELRENTLLVNAYSKAYAMTGWRVGYAVGPKRIIDAIITHQSQFTSNVCSIAQYAALRAYEDDGAFPRMMLEKFSRRREMVVDRVAEIPGLKLWARPLGAFYAFIDVSEIVGMKHESQEIRNGADFSNYLLEKWDTAVVSGDAFGADNAFRLSYAISEKTLEEGLQRIKKAVESLTR